MVPNSDSKNRLENTSIDACCKFRLDFSPYEFKKNNQKEEVLYGKKVKGSWEFLPHGKFIMFYSKKMDVYIPMRITELTHDNLIMTVFDINTMKMITVSYSSI